ncbi:hypothetical protein B0H16DRAFT_1553824 [Mycena metata]|uniref:Uncharacterized protein n=1 Tax=Mycena metata TaxID=1033252 RepID=A0AAD7IRY0_9AGAR|nr:hypothetical protein B0H16DRAFT_1553824 [Mycena metata]
MQANANPALQSGIRKENYTTADSDLEKLGYKQEMTRSRGLSYILFTIMAVLFSLAAPIATSLVAGGPARSSGG